MIVYNIYIYVVVSCCIYNLATDILNLMLICGASVSQTTQFLSQVAAKN